MSRAHQRIAACSWSLRPGSARELADRLTQAGVSRVQLALMPLLDHDAAWSDTLDVLASSHLSIASGMMECVGEDYSSIARIRETGGVMPDDTWPATLLNMRRAAPLARRLGMQLVTFHAGFIPHDTASPDFGKAVSRVREVAETFAGEGIRVALETGQEPAGALLEFLRVLGRPDVGVNFDPANMILYGSGDPITALGLLSAHVFQVHIKDALPSATPGQWGAEVPAGTGAVDWPSFFHVLSAAGYTGPFVIEREAGEHRVRDIVTARELIARLAHADAR